METYKLLGTVLIVVGLMDFVIASVFGRRLPQNKRPVFFALMHGSAVVMVVLGLAFLTGRLGAR